LNIVQTDRAEIRSAVFRLEKHLLRAGGTGDRGLFPASVIGDLNAVGGTVGAIGDGVAASHQIDAFGGSISLELKDIASWEIYFSRCNGGIARTQVDGIHVLAFSCVLDTSQQVLERCFGSRPLFTAARAVDVIASVGLFEIARKRLADGWSDGRCSRGSDRCGRGSCGAGGRGHALSELDVDIVDHSH